MQRTLVIAGLPSPETITVGEVESAGIEALGKAVMFILHKNL
jgi:hypothetical protein